MQKQADKRHVPYQYQLKHDSQFSEQNKLEFDDQLTDEENIVQKDLKIQYQKQRLSFDIFLQKEYASFNQKVNKCLLNNCYANIMNNRQFVLDCTRECTEGIRNIQGFTDDAINNVNDNFVNCLKEVKEEQFKVESLVKCNDLLLSGLESLKIQIREEMNYYI